MSDGAGLDRFWVSRGMFSGLLKPGEHIMFGVKLNSACQFVG